MQARLKGTDDAPYAKGFRNSTRFWRTVFSNQAAGWGRSSRRSVDEVIEQASNFVEALNDRYTNPSGTPRD